MILKSERNTDIYCDIVETDAADPGLAVMVHGFKAERTEGGRFTELAERLKEKGFCSIMFDQSGCGESKEPFDDYCIDNSIADIRTCIAYMIERYKIDQRKMVMVGYSMGGRITSIYTTRFDERFKTIGLWAAAITTMDELPSFVFDENGKNLREEAEQNGYGLYYNAFDDTYIHLSKHFYDNMFGYDPVEAMKKYDGNVIVVHGDQDITVDPKVAYNCFDNLTTTGRKELHIVKGANHGFGLWDDHPEQSEELVSSTFRFITSCFE